MGGSGGVRVTNGREWWGEGDKWEGVVGCEWGWDEEGVKWPD